MSVHTHPTTPNEQNDDCCSICLEGLGNGDDVYVMRPCDHQYHRACIVGWLRNEQTCPMCRTVVCGADALFEDGIITAEQLECLKGLAMSAPLTIRGVDNEECRGRLMSFYLEQFQNGNLDGALKALMQRPEMFEQSNVDDIFANASPDALLALKQLAMLAAQSLSEEDIEAASRSSMH